MRRMLRNIVIQALLHAVLGTLSLAQVVQVHVDYPPAEDGARRSGRATAVAIGEVDGAGGLWLTAAHNVADHRRVRIYLDDWREARVVAVDPQADICVMESVRPKRAMVLRSDPAARGEPVRLYGYGPMLHTEAHEPFAATVADPSTLRGVGGLHPIPGDSGGAVADAQNRLVGIISGHGLPQFTSATPGRRTRRDYAAQRVDIICVPAPAITRIVTQHYEACDRCRAADGVPVWRRRSSLPPADPQPESVTPASCECRSDVQRLTQQIAMLTQQVTVLQQRLIVAEQTPTRVMLVDGNNVVQEQTYRPGEPIVLGTEWFTEAVQTAPPQ